MKPEPDTYQDIVRYDRAAVEHGRREELVPCAIQPRDLEIIEAVRQHKFLTSPQLLELWWEGAAVQVGRRRLAKLFAAGYIDRFRPVARRGSFPWTYRLGREGHRLLQRTGTVTVAERFEPPEIYDYRYVLHHVHLNAWVMAWRRLLGDQLLRWEGELQVDPPPKPLAARRQGGGADDPMGLRDPRRRPIRPDAVLEVAARGSELPHTFLIEYDRTRRVDKNFDKFRRYDTFATAWWRDSPYAGAERPPWIVFVCQNAEQRDRFLHSADQEITGTTLGAEHDADGPEFPCRRRLLFVSEASMHAGQAIARRLPDVPLTHRARRSTAPTPTVVRLPGHRVTDDPAPAAPIPIPTPEVTAP